MTCCGRGRGGKRVKCFAFCFEWRLHFCGNCRIIYFELFKRQLGLPSTPTLSPPLSRCVQSGMSNWEDERRPGSVSSLQFRRRTQRLLIKRCNPSISSFSFLPRNRSPIQSSKIKNEWLIALSSVDAAVNNSAREKDTKKKRINRDPLYYAQLLWCQFQHIGQLHAISIKTIHGILHLKKLSICYLSLSLSLPGYIPDSIDN